MRWNRVISQSLFGRMAVECTLMATLLERRARSALLKYCRGDPPSLACHLVKAVIDVGSSLWMYAPRLRRTRKTECAFIRVVVWALRKNESLLRTFCLHDWGSRLF